MINGMLSNLRCFCSPTPQVFGFRTQFFFFFSQFLMLLLLYIDARFWIEFCVLFFCNKEYCGIYLGGRKMGGGC